jgi:hypothetical protein
MNRSMKAPPRLPTRPIRLKESGYRRRWKPVERTARLSEKAVLPEPQPLPNSVAE